MSILYGHQLNITYTWLTRGVDCCWLGDFGVGMDLYKQLDARAEAEWVKENDGVAPRDWHEFSDYVGRKKMFHKLWLPNPVSVLPNAMNDEGFHTWVEEVYPYASYPYLPVPVFADLLKSYRRCMAAGLPYTCIKGRKSGGIKLPFGIDPTPVDHPPATLLRNFILREVARWRGKAKRMGDESESIFEGMPQQPKVLFPNAGCLSGVAPLALMTTPGFQGNIKCLDSDPEMISALQMNSTRLRDLISPKRRRWIQFTADISHSLYPLNKTFDLAVLTPSWMPPAEEIEGGLNFGSYFDLCGQRDANDFVFGRDFFAKSADDDVAYQLENIGNCMQADGIVIVLWSNIRNIVFDTAEHPIVEHLEKNYDFSLLHFEDIPWRVASVALQKQQGMPFLSDLNRKLKTELWVLRVNRPTLPTPSAKTTAKPADTKEANEQQSTPHSVVPVSDDAVLPVQEQDTVEGLIPQGRLEAAERSFEEFALTGVDPAVLAKVRVRADRLPRAETPNETLLNYVQPPIQYEGSYTQVKHKVRRDKRVGVAAAKASEIGIGYQTVLRAQKLEQAEDKERLSARRRLMKELGLARPRKPYRAMSGKQTARLRAQTSMDPNDLS